MTATANSIVQSLVALGGSEWVRDDKHRVYFNDVAAFAGYEVTRYGTGRVSSVSRDGVALSNIKGTAALAGLPKIWFDVLTGEFMSNQPGTDTSARIVAAITAAIA